MKVGAPYQRHSETSYAAALAAVEFADNARGRVYRFIRDAGDHGATDAEIQTGLPMNGNTQRPRRGELAKRGLIKDSGATRDKSTVWIVATPERTQGQLFE